jgi:dTDP-4-dehydrorhamnose 3,5-epimerase
LNNAYLIELEKHEDERGFFARSWCQKEFKKNGLVDDIVQANISFNIKKGTMRGLHYQITPHAETKLVRCTRGAIYDVIIDLDSSSNTYRQWMGIELTQENYKLLYVPRGFAHGFQTLENDTEITYLTSEFYAPQAERGIRYNDPFFDIKWPLPLTEISEKDGKWPNYD